MADDIQKNGAVNVPVTPPNDAANSADNIFSDDPNSPFNETKQELRTRFMLLPEEIQKTLVDEDYQVKLFEIAKSLKLTYEELSILEVETSMVLLGMVKPGDYRSDLQEQLKKNDPEIDTLVAQVNEKVFAPVRTAIEKVFAVKTEPIDFLKDTSTDVQTPATTPVAAPTAPSATAVPISIFSSGSRSQAVDPMPTPSLTSNEKTILEKTGVVITDTPTPAPAMTAVKMPDRNDLLKSIENPPKTQNTSMVANKLGTTGPVIPAVKTTDYSIAKPAAPVAMPSPTAAPHDPYREPIE